MTISICVSRIYDRRQPLIPNIDHNIAATITTCWPCLQTTPCTANYSILPMMLFASARGASLPECMTQHQHSAPKTAPQTGSHVVHRGPRVALRCGMVGTPDPPEYLWSPPSLHVSALVLPISPSCPPLYISSSFSAFSCSPWLDGLYSLVVKWKMQLQFQDCRIFPLLLSLFSFLSLPLHYFLSLPSSAFFFSSWLDGPY